MPEVTPQTTQTFQTLMEAWELKKVLKILSIVDADVVIMPLGTKYSANLVRLEALGPDHTVLAAVDTVGLFNKLNYSIMIGGGDVKKLLKVIPWSRMLVSVVFEGSSLSVHSMDGTARINITIVEKPESILNGLDVKQWHPKAIMRDVDASTLLSWLKPFSIVGRAEARFKLLYNGFMVDANNEGATLMLDTKLVPGEYTTEDIFEVGYNLRYIVEFLEEVKRGRVNVVLGYGKPMVVESELEGKASVETTAYIIQAPMVE